MIEADGGSTCQLSSVESVPAWEACGSQFWVEVSPTAQERQGPDIRGLPAVRPSTMERVLGAVSRK